MNQTTDGRDRALAELKAAIDAKWNANKATLIKSLDQGLLSWRRGKNGFEVKLKPDI